jgi:hypothetical protein
VVRSVNAAKRGLNLSIKHHQLSVQLEQSAAADKKQKKDKKKTAAPTDVFEASLAVGRVVAAQIMRTDPQRGLLLRFSKSNMGRAHITVTCFPLFHCPWSRSLNFAFHFSGLVR